MRITAGRQPPQPSGSLMGAKGCGRLVHRYGRLPRSAAWYRIMASRPYSTRGPTVERPGGGIHPSSVRGPSPWMPPLLPSGRVLEDPTQREVCIPGRTGVPDSTFTDTSFMMEKGEMVAEASTLQTTCEIHSRPEAVGGVRLLPTVASSITAKVGGPVPSRIHANMDNSVAVQKAQPSNAKGALVRGTYVGSTLVWSLPCPPLSTQDARRKRKLLASSRRASTSETSQCGRNEFQYAESRDTVVSASPCAELPGTPTELLCCNTFEARDSVRPSLLPECVQMKFDQDITTVHGWHFNASDCLGKGAYSRVYLARNIVSKPNESYALKVIQLNLSSRRIVPPGSECPSWGYGCAGCSGCRLDCGGGEVTSEMDTEEDSGGGAEKTKRLCKARDGLRPAPHPIPAYLFREIHNAQYGGGHKNIVRCFKSYLGPTQAYLLFEHMDCDMGHFISHLCYRAPPPLHFARSCLRHIFRALAHLHSRSICHRDIKCDNILARVRNTTPGQFQKWKHLCMWRRRFWARIERYVVRVARYQEKESFISQAETVPLSQREPHNGAETCQWEAVLVGESEGGTLPATAALQDDDVKEPTTSFGLPTDRFGQELVGALRRIEWLFLELALMRKAHKYDAAQQEEREKKGLVARQNAVKVLVGRHRPDAVSGSGTEPKERGNREEVGKGTASAQNNSKGASTADLMVLTSSGDAGDMECATTGLSPRGPTSNNPACIIYSKTISTSKTLPTHTIRENARLVYGLMGTLPLPPEIKQYVPETAAAHPVPPVAPGSDGRVLPVGRSTSSLRTSDWSTCTSRDSENVVGAGNDSSSSLNRFGVVTDYSATALPSPPKTVFRLPAAWYPSLTFKLGDLGLSYTYLAPEISALSEVVTLWYRPPELLLGCERYDQAADLWSMGCVAFELVAGELPFQGDTDVEVMMKAVLRLGPPTQKDVRSWRHSPFFQTPFWPSGIRAPTDPFGDIADRIDPSGRDFIARLLRFNPQERMTAEEALQHPWLRDVSDEDDEA